MILALKILGHVLVWGIIVFTQALYWSNIDKPVLKLTKPHIHIIYWLAVLGVATVSGFFIGWDLR